MNKKSINYGLKVLTLLAFSLIFIPNHVFAQQALYGYGANNGSGNSNSGYAYSPYTNSYYNTTPYQPPIYTAPTPPTTPVVYSSGANPNTGNGSSVMTVTYTPTATPAAKTATTTKTATATAATNSNSGNALAANAVYGSNSFLPSGLIQWILFGIFILLLIILVRKIFGAEKNYHATPLKHE